MTSTDSNPGCHEATTKASWFFPSIGVTKTIFSSPLVTFLILLLLKNLKVIKETNTKKSREIKEKLILEQKEKLKRWEEEERLSRKKKKLSAMSEEQQQRYEYLLYKKESGSLLNQEEFIEIKEYENILHKIKV